ncbi:Serine protease 56 [Massospora cicadina]|nr:Serine protease 56 [Massospora cicadina]
MISLLLLALFSVTESKSKPEGRIIGGDIGDVSQYRYLVRIQADGFMCGGGLVSSTALVTAAHCTTNKDPMAYDIREGKNYQREMDQPTCPKLKATSVHPHPQYSPNTVVNDIGIIRVEPNPKFSHFLALDTTNMATDGLQWNWQFNLSRGLWKSRRV